MQKTRIKNDDTVSSTGICYWQDSRTKEQVQFLMWVRTRSKLWIQHFRCPLQNVGS
jgi:hypothetical protein